jgi:fermentation-respiration switch protein FrsA (DUF1100 family)
MRFYFSKLLIASLTVACGCAMAQIGDYLGTVQVGAIQLRVALHVTKQDDGALVASIDSLDQGARGLPVQLTIDGKTVRFGSKFGMSYEGMLNEAGDVISGFATQGGQKLALDFKKVDKIEGAKRPQMPARPFPYTEEEVALQNGQVKLGGTLSLPKGDGPFPAAIFLTGSGAQDRDETLFEHKPFLVISDYLVRNGIATLRLDDRGVGKSTGNLAYSTIEDLAGDAIAALEFLKTRKEIHARKIGFLGHSEGGVTGPLAAVRSSEAAFVILLAAPGVVGDQILIEQGQFGLKAANAPAEVLAFQKRFHDTFLPLVKTERDNDVLAKKLVEAWEKWKSEDPVAKSMDRQVAPQLQQLLLPAMHGFIRHDPAPVLSQLKCPVLALNGTLDTQVPYYQNLPAITLALAKASHPDFTVTSIPHLNHLFQTAKTGSLTEYRQIEETISPRVLELLAQWLKARV